MTLTNHLKKAVAGLGLLGILAACGSSLPPARAHTDVYYRNDVSPQLKRSNALYDIKAILADDKFCVESNADERGIYCTTSSNAAMNKSAQYQLDTGCQWMLSKREFVVNMSWEDVRARTLIIRATTFGGVSLGFADYTEEFSRACNEVHRIYTRDETQAEQLKQSIEQYLLYRHAQ